MNHQDVRARLSEYIDGDLALRQRALVDAHLDGCHLCREELSELRVTVRLLRDLGDVVPRTAIADAVMDRVRAGEGVPSWWSRFTARLEDLTQPRIVRPLVLCAMGLAGLFLVRPELMRFVLQPLGGGVPIATRGAPPPLSTLPLATASLPRQAGGPLGAASAERSSERPQMRVVWARPFGTSGPIELRGDLARRHVPLILSGTPLAAEGPLFASPGWPSMGQSTRELAEPASFRGSSR